MKSPDHILNVHPKLKKVKKNRGIKVSPCKASIG